MDANTSNITPILPTEGMDGTAAASVAAAATAYAQFALQAAALIPGQDGQLVLPSGVSLDNIRVVGRDLVIRMPDGSEVVVPDGAVFVPQFVVDGVAVPPVNLAALLIGQEPQPAAGPPQSSGGNFSQAPGDIGDPFGLGDLLPPTELAFPEPEQRELVPGLVDRDPDVNIQDGGPAGKDVTDNVSEVGLPGTRTNSNVESPGSSAGNGSDSTTGAIIVTSPDGIASITINGVVYTGAGQQITTPNGVLTLGALTGDQIPYTYRLTDNTSGDATTDVFTVVLTDPDGDSSTARLTIVIADDVPTARNDTDSVAGGTFGPETGNVLSGAGTTSGAAGADTLGADGGTISGFRAGTSGSFAAVGTTIAGQYGTLTIGANGSYTYVRNTNTPGGVTDVFSYQLTDGDGDASTATLTINIGDAPNRITFIPEIGDGTQVREPHLPARDGEPSGSQFDGNNETTSGTITFNSPDGLGSVTVSGVTVTPGALPQTIVSNATGTLVITASTYNPATGVGSITYNYTLNDNTLNTAGSTVTFPVVVTDLDGDAASDDLNINIIDDAPKAVADSDSIAAGSYGPATGNVITDTEADGGKDTMGADGAAVAGVAAGDTGTALVSAGTVGAAIQGSYGKLTLNADGSYSYVRDPGTPGGVNDVFTYTLRDGDGDTSVTTLTVSIADSLTTLRVPGVEEDGTLVFESGLPERGSEPAGSAGGDGEITNGVISFTAPDGPATLTIGGTEITAIGQTVTGTFGTLTITSIDSGSVGYRYVLADNTVGDGTQDSFAIKVTDVDGDSTSDTLTIDIYDDRPTAVADTDNIASGNYGPATGNVITDAEADGGLDTQGADGALVAGVAAGDTGTDLISAGTVGAPIQGTYGKLTLNADGSYSYVRDAGTAGGVSDVFTYTLRDGDGDTSTTTLTVAIANSLTSLDVPTEGEAGTSVSETGLPARGLEPAGSAGDASETTAGIINYTAPDGPATVTINGVAITTVGQLVTTAFGTMTITSVANGSIGYSYTLADNVLDTPASDDFAVVVTDKDTDSSNATLSIAIRDDAPTAIADADSVTEDGPLVADGNVLTASGGADANGTDGVADTQGADGAKVTGVAAGTAASAVSGGLGGAGVAGTYGTLILNADGSYSYALNNALQPVQGLSAGQSLTDIFSYTITDSDGEQSTATLTITINGADDLVVINGLDGEGAELTVDEDDLAARAGEAAGSDTTPDAVSGVSDSDSFNFNSPDGLNTVVLDSFNGTALTTPLTLVSGGVFTAQTVATAYGALNITGFTPITGTDGSIIGGTFTYGYTLTDNRADHGAAGQDGVFDSFGVTVTDSDGSSDSATIDVRIVDDVPTAVADGIFNVVEQTPLKINVYANDVAGADSVNTDTGIALATAPTKGVAVDNGDGTFTYTPNAGAEGPDSFTYTITDGDGDVSTTTVTLNLLPDSIPEIVSKTNLTVDEDGLRGANADNGLAGEVTSTGSTTATGTLVAQFYADVPTNLLGSITLNDSGALDGQLVTLAGVPITFAKDGNDLVGSAGGVDYVRIAITGAALGPAAGEVTYTYTATLLQPVQHAVAGSEDSDLLSGIGFTVTDSEIDTASGSFNVTVVDDLPTLEISAATAEVTEGGAPYNGAWVLDRGADGVTTMSINVNGTVQSLTLTPETPAAVFTLAQGTLTFRPDGTYTFQPNGNLDQDVPQTVTLTVSGADRDGDPFTDNIVITINDGAGPMGGDTSTLTVNEAALDTPAATGSDPILTTEVASDTLAFTAGSDNLVDFRFAGVADLVANIDGAGTDLFWTLSVDGRTITGALTDGGPAAITIALTAPASIAATTSGTVGVTVTLADNLPHELALAAQTAGLGTVTVVASDQDGDSATGIVTVQVVDDIPDITGNAAAAAALSVDDTTLTSNATANMASLFTINYNADGPAATGSIAYTLSIAADGTDSGVKDTATGQAVLLTNEAGVIVGRTATGGDIVFTVTVNATTGSVTLDQVRAVVHSPDTGANQFFDLAADLINLTATIKDGDGDIDSETVGISQGMRFFDDGLRSGSLSVSNEGGVLLTTQDAETIAAASDFAVTTANFSGVFGTSANYGNDLPGTTVLTYALATVGGAPDSGLESHGAPITLYNIAGVITGSTAASLGAVDAANTIFTIAVGTATGIVTLTQYAEIDHAGPGVDSGFDTQFATLANNLVRLTGTAVYTDGDGDTTSLNLNVDLGGNVRFADDGPALTTTLKNGALLTIDETNGVVAAGTEVDPDATGNLGSATIAIGDLYTSTVVSGADGPATLTYKLIVTDNTPSGYFISSTNESINLFRVSDTVVEGRGAISGNVALTFSIAANGTVTMTQLIAIEHTDTTNHDETSGGMNAGVLFVETTATDFDNDFDKATVDLGSIVRIEDDGPSITNVTQTGAVTLDETGGLDANVLSSAAAIGGTFNFGSDGAATSDSIVYGLELTAGGTSVLTSLATAVGDFLITLVETATNQVTGRYVDGGGVTRDAFTVTIGTDGKLTVTQLVALEHLQDGDTPLHNDALTLNGFLTASVTIKDSDGDTTTATAQVGDQVTFLDDGPSVTATAATNVLVSNDETATSSLAAAIDTGAIIKGNDPDVTDAGYISTATSTGSVVTAAPNYGADGAATPPSLAYALVATSSVSGVTLTDGTAINLVQVGNAIVGQVAAGISPFAGQAAFAIAIDSTTGQVTVEQYLSLKHPTNPNNDETIQLTAGGVGVQVTATDSDGDFAKSAVTDISAQIRFDDDGPSLTNILGGGSVVLDETGGFDTISSTTSAISFTAAFGADGKALADDTLFTIERTTGTATTSLQTAVGNLPISLVQTAPDIIKGQYNDGTVKDAFIVTINGDGTITVQQLVALEHLDDGFDAAAYDDELNLDGLITARVTIKDGDGDTTSATTQIGDQIVFRDDGLTANPDTKSVDEGTVVNGNVLTDNADIFGRDGADATVPAGGVVGVKAGSDISAPVTTGTATVIETTLGFLTLNADGSYIYDSKGNTVGTTALTDTFVYTIRDADGDTSTTTLTITINPVTLVADSERFTVNEAGIDTTNDAGPDTVAGTVNGTTPGSDSDVAQGTLAVTGATEYVLTSPSGGSYGTLVLSSGGSYIYTLTKPFDTTPDDNNGIRTETGKDVFNYTATDANGNSVNGTITVDIIDDVPTATATAVPGSVAALDETATTSTAATLGVDNIGNDPDVGGDGRISFTLSSGAVATAGGVYGADGANTVDPLIFNLVVDNPTSGLFVTDGAAIDLVEENGVVVGRVATGTLAGQAAFAIAINPTSGVVTVEQYLSLKHLSSPNPDDTISLADGTLGVTVTRTDGDGDKTTSASADISGQIRFDDDGPTETAATSSVTVDEDELTFGVTDSDAELKSASGSLGGLANFGSDGAGSFTFDLTGASMPSLKSGSLAVKYEVSGNGLQLIGYTGANSASGQVFTLTITNSATGAYTFDLLGQLDHIGPLASGSGDDQILTLDLSNAVIATDGDGDSIRLSDGFTITVEDDIPAPYSTAPGTATGPNVGGTTDTELLNLPPVGADQPGTLEFSVTSGQAFATNGSALTFNGQNIFYSLNAADASILEAKTASGIPVFTIDLNQGSGQYIFTQYQQLSTAILVPVANLSSVGGGNNSIKAIDVPSSPYDLVLTTVSGETINTSSNYMAIGDGQSFKSGEVLRIDFVNVSISGSGGSALATFNEYYSANAFRQDIWGLSGAQRAAFTIKAIDVANNPNGLVTPADGDTVFYGDLSTGSPTATANDTVVSGTTLNIYNAAGVLQDATALGTAGVTVTNLGGGVWQVTGLPNDYDYEIVSENTPFEAVQVEAIAGTGTFKLGALSTSVLQVQGVTFSVPIQLTDADGDSVSSTITINLSAPSSPVVLDLDGDGAEFLSSAAGVAFDYAGDGNSETTAWVGADDGLVAIDRNGDGLVNDGSEIVFGGNGLTDLQGLAANYDSNKDGVLDANDADFAKFGVWQDANSNGVTDAGEFQSLSDAGITSINLVSDGVEYAAANGDVTVHGTSSFIRADGTTGDVADASFATSNATKVAANENDQRVLVSANAGMAGSMVAAGLVAAVAIEHDAIDAVLSNVGNFDGGSRADSFAGLQSAPFETGQTSDFFRGLNSASDLTSNFGDNAAKFSSYDRMADTDAFQNDSFGGDRIDAITSNLLAPTELDHGMFNMSNGSSMGMAVDAGSQALIALQDGGFAQSALQDVVADALAGGVGEGANVDALLNALAGPANEMSLLGDSLAQTFGDNPVFEALSFNSGLDTFDQITTTQMELSAATGHHG